MNILNSNSYSLNEVKCDLDLNINEKMNENLQNIEIEI